VSVLKEFEGLAHRTQWVAHDKGVTFINDSKGTNLGATYAAIEGLGPTLSDGKIILIAGGQGKGADFTPMRPLLEKYVRHVILIGQDAHLLEQQWAGVISMQHAKNLAEAVMFARDYAHAGDIVLLSPACASLDMFKNYEDRGQQFVDLVKGLK
ncbi:MAG: UDP-N-acetylmuramoyl-L-alanine--D-glutamate ligase, partial [Chitinophagia bacterium]|nr:UDP-N-acetylmuramoyl-L-alanine--D-glutamate ligase [Chitinophagia bacterium]